VNTVETLPHHVPQELSDRFALATARSIRGLADLHFAKRYGDRALVLEAVAAVPGMVGAMATHLQSLRRMVDDDGWIRTPMEEAENEQEAVVSHTAYLEEIDAGRAANVEAPEIARKYWNLSANATLHDVVLVVRADEARHRGVNHSFASELADEPVDPQMLAPQPWHADVTDRRA